jgi:hypothetical protein
MLKRVAFALLICSGCSQQEPTKAPAPPSGAPASIDPQKAGQEEPTYKGVPLSAWAKRARDLNHDTKWDGLRALEFSGQAGWPYFVELMRDKETRWDVSQHVRPEFWKAHKKELIPIVREMEKDADAKRARHGKWIMSILTGEAEAQGFAEAWKMATDPLSVNRVTGLRLLVQSGNPKGERLVLDYLKAKDETTAYAIQALLPEFCRKHEGEVRPVLQRIRRENPDLLGVRRIVELELNEWFDIN